jgi:hypothetical protein
MRGSIGGEGWATNRLGQALPADQLAFLFVFGPVDLAAGKTLIQNVKRGGACVGG